MNDCFDYFTGTNTSTNTTNTDTDTGIEQEGNEVMSEGDLQQRIIGMRVVQGPDWTGSTTDTIASTVKLSKDEVGTTTTFDMRTRVATVLWTTPTLEGSYKLGAIREGEGEKDGGTERVFQVQLMDEAVAGMVCAKGSCALAASNPSKDTDTDTDTNWMQQAAFGLVLGPDARMYIGSRLTFGRTSVSLCIIIKSKCL
jgi:hypothetical protein